jgi:hypothetical protein
MDLLTKLARMPPAAPSTRQRTHERQRVDGEQTRTAFAPRPAAYQKKSPVSRYSGRTKPNSTGGPRAAVAIEPSLRSQFPENGNICGVRRRLSSTWPVESPNWEGRDRERTIESPPPVGFSSGPGAGTTNALLGAQLSNSQITSLPYWLGERGSKHEALDSLATLDNGLRYHPGAGTKAPEKIPFSSTLGANLTNPPQFSRTKNRVKQRDL